MAPSTATQQEQHKFHCTLQGLWTTSIYLITCSSAENKISKQSYNASKKILSYSAIYSGLQGALSNLRNVAIHCYIGSLIPQKDHTSTRRHTQSFKSQQQPVLKSSPTSTTYHRHALVNILVTFAIQQETKKNRKKSSVISIKTKPSSFTLVSYQNH